MTHETATTGAGAQDAHLVSLLACAATGSEHCFEELYDALAPSLYGLIRRILRDPAQAEEVAQEVFLEIWQKAGRYDPAKASVRSWVTVIAHRRAVDRVRAARAASDRDLRQGMAEFRETYEHVHQTVEAHLEAEEVGRALTRLPAPQAEAITLAYFGGYTQRQIAERLVVPLGTVKTRMRQGMSTLRTLLGGQDAPHVSTR